MISSLQRMGDLSCRIVSDLPAGSSAQLVVMLCHGFGAPGDDLVPLGSEILRARPDLCDRVAFVFPAAPIMLEQPLAFDSRAWWPLDMERLMIPSEDERAAYLRSHAPPLLPKACQKLESTRAVVQEQFQIGSTELIVGGFSQGAMLTTELALSCGEALAGLAVFSGTLLDGERWAKLAGEIPALRVIQSHGELDPILPFSNAEALYQMLIQHHHDVTFLPFPGVHTIPPQALQSLVELIDERLES